LTAEKYQQYKSWNTSGSAIPIWPNFINILTQVKSGYEYQHLPTKYPENQAWQRDATAAYMLTASSS